MINETLLTFVGAPLGVAFFMAGGLKLADDLLTDQPARRVRAVRAARHAVPRTIDGTTKSIRVAELRQRLGDQPYYPQPAAAQGRP